MSTDRTPVIVLTGASRGIGHAIATSLLQDSTTNLVLVSRTAAPLEAFQKQAPDRVEIVAGDITDRDVAGEAVGAAIGKWGCLDGIIVNHGTLQAVDKVANLEVEDWRQGFEINVFAAVALTRLALPHLRVSNGRIIYISSGAANKGNQSWGIYGATKAAINSLAMTVAAEEPDVTVVAVRPGVVDTDMTRSLRSEHKDKIAAAALERFETMASEGTMSKPEEVGRVIGRMALHVDKAFSGKFVSWDDEAFKKYLSE